MLELTTLVFLSLAFSMGGVAERALQAQLVENSIISIQYSIV